MRGMEVSGIANSRQLMWQSLYLHYIRAFHRFVAHLFAFAEVLHSMLNIYGTTRAITNKLFSASA